MLPGELSEGAQCSAGFEGVVDLPLAGDEGFPSVFVGQILKMRFTVSAAQAVCLVDGDDAKPEEGKGGARLASQQDRPGGLAGVFDQLARGVDDASHCALELAVMAAVEVGHVFARRVGA